MKVILCFFIFYSSQIFSQSSIYDLYIQKPEGDSISMSMFKGNKILIIAVSQDNLQKSDLNFWDSVQISNAPLVVILVPADDFGKTVDDSTIAVIKSNLSTNIILSDDVLVKKSEGQNQDPILQWLTHTDENTHFNAEITSGKQIYVVSESGVLYAVLEKGVPAQVLDQLLKQQDVIQ